MSAPHPRLEWNEADEHDWDPENHTVGIALFASAIQVWSVFQPGATSVGDAARAFNVNPVSVIEAVKHHPWMLLTGPSDAFDLLIIEHEAD